IERVAKENKKSRGTLRGGRLLKLKKIFQKALCQTDPFDKSVISDHSKRQARLEGLSMVTKNKRKPPQRVSKPRELPELSSDDDDELQAPLMKSVRFNLYEEPDGGSDSEAKAQEEGQDEEQWESSSLDDDDDDNSEW
ncbi:hypothetical protein OG21DRAFT_1526413, partial [Imleria badia]